MDCRRGGQQRVGIKVAKRATPEDGAGIGFVQSGAKSLAELVENGVLRLAGNR